MSYDNPVSSQEQNLDPEEFNKVIRILRAISKYTNPIDKHFFDEYSLNKVEGNFIVSATSNGIEYVFVLPEGILINPNKTEIFKVTITDYVVAPVESVFRLLANRTKFSRMWHRLDPEEVERIPNLLRILTVKRENGSLKTYEFSHSEAEKVKIESCIFDVEQFDIEQ